MERRCSLYSGGNYGDGGRSAFSVCMGGGNITKNWARWMMLLIAVGIMLSINGCVEKSEPRVEMVLSNYPKLFEKDVIIVVGDNATQVEMEGAQAIAENLGGLTGNLPVIKKDVGITENEKAGNNLILVGRPDSNSMLREVYERTNVTRLTQEYPGAGKGMLEILRNPWDAENTILLVTGNDASGVVGGSIAIKNHRSGVSLEIIKPEKFIGDIKFEPFGPSTGKVWKLSTKNGTYILRFESSKIKVLKQEGIKAEVEGYSKKRETAIPEWGGIRPVTYNELFVTNITQIPQIQNEGE